MDSGTLAARCRYPVVAGRPVLWPDSLALGGRKVTCLWCFDLGRMDGIVAGRMGEYGLLDGIDSTVPCLGQAYWQPVCAGGKVRSGWRVVRNWHVDRRPAATGEKK